MTGYLKLSDFSTRGIEQLKSEIILQITNYINENDIGSGSVSVDDIVDALTITVNDNGKAQVNLPLNTSNVQGLDDLIIAINDSIANLFIAIGDKSNIGHQHVISDIDGLQDGLDEKISVAEVDTKLNDYYTNVTDNIMGLFDKLNAHEKSLINSETGLHGIRIWNNKLELYDEATSAWINAIQFEGVPDATTTSKGIVQLSSSYESDTESTVATSKAVHDMYQLFYTNYASLVDYINTHKDGIASTTQLGHVKIDDNTIKISADGVISAKQPSHTHLISEITNLQSTLDNLRTDVDKKPELPITVNQVNETSDKVFVSSSQRSQITSNTSAIDINTQRIQNLEDSIGAVTSTDEKVKMNASDVNSGYLEDKIDNSTIQNNNGKLTVSFINNLQITPTELNHLQGVNSNIQQQINNLSGVSAFRGVFNSLDDLQMLSDAQEGEYAIVSDGANSAYHFYFGSQWGYSHETTTAVNIDLLNTTGSLPKDRYEKQNANETSVLNTQGNFIGNSVEDVLNELFTLSNNSKNGIVSVIGFPLVNSDTFTQIKNKIEQLKVLFSNYLVAHKLSAYPYEPLSSLIEKVKSIEAIETTGSTKIKENIIVTNTPHVENILLNTSIPIKQFGMSVVEFTEGKKNVEHYNADFSKYDGMDIDISNGIGIQNNYEYLLAKFDTLNNGVLLKTTIDRKPNVIKF